MKENNKRKLSFHTIGCRLNQYETERMAAALYPHGFSKVIKGEPADLYIINTCTVTHRADSSSRQLIKKAVRENPNSRVVVAGCYVDSDVDTVSALDGVDAVISNQEKSRIAEILLDRFPELFDKSGAYDNSDQVALFDQYNRAWLKVSDGCNQRCSFCILPQVRGGLKNRSVNEILTEIRLMCQHGFEEVVLTGVNIGHYKNRGTEPQAKNLAQLCRIILAETDLPRLRISSIEPQTVRDDLLEVFANSKGRICRHFHLPLQSGSSRILRLMRRPYDREIYIKRASAAKNTLPDTIIGADVIVGFPGETDEDFQHTKELVSSGLIDYLHVFSYSDRSGTVATELTEKINHEIIKERNAILTDLSHKIRAEAHQRQIGKTVEVIAEHSQPKGGDWFGIADNFLKVRMPKGLVSTRRIVRLKIERAYTDFVDGVPIS